MNKYVRILSAAVLMSLSCLPTVSVLAEEGKVNISPVEKIEELIETETSEVVEESEAISTEESIEFEENVEATADLTETVDPSVPHTLIAAIKDQQTHTTSDVTFFENTSVDTFNEYSRAYIRDEDIYYFIMLDSQTLPEMFMLSLEDNEVMRSFTSVDDLMGLAAEALNTDPETYVGTIIEDFYQVSQENMDLLTEKFVEETEINPDHETVLRETQALDTFMLDVIAEWLQHESVNGTGVEVDDGMVFGLDEVTEPVFAEIVAKHAADYPELEPLLAQFSTGYQGNVALNFELGELGLGIVGAGGGIQYFIRLEEFEIPMPTDEQLLSKEEFVELVGFDIIAEYRTMRSEIREAAE